MTTEQRHTCPRRHESGMTDPNSPFAGSGTGLDTWTTGHGLIGQESIGPSCSYCGSLHPNRFMELAREGWEVGPTDKNYKAYLCKPLTASEEAQQKADWIQHDAVARAVREVGERDGKAPEQIAADLDEQWGKLPRFSRGPEAKFYYPHLSAEQRDEFITLHNEGRMKISYPGHLYVLPFFAGPATA